MAAHPAPLAPATRVAPAIPASAGRWCRAGVITPRGRVDLALPADVPVAELVPMVLELIGEPARPAGTDAEGRDVPRPWRLSGPAGGLFGPEATLAGLGVLDGELLHLGPRSAALPAPVFDDPADALAGAVRDRGAGPALRHAGAVAAPVVATAAATLLATVRGAVLPVVVVAVAVGLLGAGAALAYAHRLLLAAGSEAAGSWATGSRAAGSAATGTWAAGSWATGAGDTGAGDAGPDPAAGAAARAAALCAVPAAAAAGTLVLPGAFGSGQILFGALGAGLAAVFGLVVLRAVGPVLLTAAVIGPVVAAAAVVRLATDAPVAAVGAGLAAVALAAGPVLPRAALRAAGMPAPTVPTDLDEISRADTAVLPAPEMTARADLARDLFAGLSAPAALLAAGGAVLSCSDGGWPGALLAAVTVAVLLLRARAFAEPGPAQVLGAAAVATAVGAGVLAPLAHGPLVRLVVAAALGVAVLVAARGRSGRMSPVGRRALDVLELVLTAAAIPAALAAMGLFALVRGL